MRTCVLTDEVCPKNLYHHISYHKYTSSTKLGYSFGDDYQKRLQEINGLSRTATITGPAMGEENACILTCHKVVNGSETVIFKARYSGVIQGLLLRVYNPATLELERDWNQMLVTIRWDGEEKPQIDRIPLGLFIGSAQGFLNPMDAVISGLKIYKCIASYKRSLPNEDFTGYIFYPMPFWKSAEISLSVAPQIRESIACFSIDVVRNPYKVQDTGYFQTAMTVHTSASPFLKMHLNTTGWGHMVGIHHNLNHVNKNVMENDPFIHIDGSSGPIVMGTGVEDFHGIGHAFQGQIDTTYPFTGNSHCTRNAKDFVCQFYRHLIFDPIPFTTGLTMYHEGDCKGNYDSHVFEQPLAENGQDSFFPEVAGRPWCSFMVETNLAQR